jgi:integrase
VGERAARGEVTRDQGGDHASACRREAAHRGAEVRDKPPEIPLSESTVRLLKDHKKEQAERRLLSGPVWGRGNPEGLTDFVFDRWNGQPLEPDSFAHRFANAAERAGFPEVRFHDLRHGFATRLIADGVNAKVVSELLGHADVSFTLRVYTHPTDDMKRRAIELLTGESATE